MEASPFTAATLVASDGTPAVGETSLAVGPGGAMIVCIVDSAKVYASLDGGATWTSSEPFGGDTNGDCDVAIGDDGAWHAVWAERAERVAVSRDRGATWEAQTVTASPVNCVGNPATGSYTACLAHRPWLRATGGRVDVTYYDIRPTVVVFQRSEDAGASWGAPTAVASNGGFGYVGKMAVSDDGRTVRVPLMFPVNPTRQSDGFRLEIATSTDGGATWSTQAATGALDLRRGIPAFVAHEDRLVLGAALVNGSLADVAVWTSDDGGASWSEPLVLATGVDFDDGYALVALDAGPQGFVAAWYALEGERGWSASFAGLGAEGTGVAWRAEAPPLGGAPEHLEFFTMAHDEAGRLHVVLPVPRGPCGDEAQCIYHFALRPQG